MTGPAKATDDWVLTEACHEREGWKWRSVYIVEPSEAWEEHLWARLKGLPSMFGIVPLVDRHKLQRLYDKNLMWFAIDCVGIACVDLTTRSMPNVHVTYWDARMRGRESLGRRLCEWLLEFFDVPAVFTQCPAASRVVIAHAKRIGFKVSNWYCASTINAANELDDLVELTYRSAPQPLETT